MLMATFILKLLAFKGRDITLVEGMERYPFIFSGERKWKLRRHFTFWFTWWLFSGILYSFSAWASKISLIDKFPISLIESFFYLAPHIFLAYSLMYWVVPRILLKGKYVLSLFAVGFLFLATALLSALIGMYILPEIRASILDGSYRYIIPIHINEIHLFNALLAGLRGAITIGGLAAAIKLMKYWYVKEQRNLQLQRQNAEAQLQLLKAQVHPHFLFNTLNNIYSYTQKHSPVASQLVMGLSDLLRYMLYDCNQPLVPLRKEIKMLRDYISLEQVRYDDGLDVVLDLPENTEGLYIAPLLLLPFVENCFKHGTSQVIEQPWISLRIEAGDSGLEMKLVNGKANKKEKDGSKGIGISNVRHRLELLYPGRHELKISNDEHVFVVDLTLQLEKRIRKDNKIYKLAEV